MDEQAADCARMVTPPLTVYDAATHTILSTLPNRPVDPNVAGTVHWDGGCLKGVAGMVTSHRKCALARDPCRWLRGGGCDDNA